MNIYLILHVFLDHFGLFHCFDGVDFVGGIALLAAKIHFAEGSFANRLHNFKIVDRRPDFSVLLRAVCSCHPGPGWSSGQQSNS